MLERLLGVASKRWFPAALAAVAGIASGVGNLNGLAVGDDGVGYSAIANGIYAGTPLGYFIEPRLTVWPPLWPALMAAFSAVFGVQTTTSAAMLNALCAALLTGGAWAFLGRVVQWTGIAREAQLEIRLLGTVAVALGGSTVLFTHLLMTDLALATITVWLWVVAERAVRGQSLLAVVGAAALGELAFFTRYAGITVIPFVGLWLLVAWPNRRRFVAAGGFAVLGLVGPVLWMARNRSIDGTLLGVRYESNRGLFANAYDMASTLGNFLLPGIELERRALWLAIGMIGVAVVGWIVWRSVEHPADRVAWWDRCGRWMKGPVGLAMIQVVGFGMYIWYVRSTTALNRLDVRLLNPLYFGLVVLGLALLASAAHRSTNRAAVRLARFLPRVWAGSAVALGLAMLVYFASGAEIFVGDYRQDRYEGIRSSEALGELPRSCFYQTRAEIAGTEVAVLPTAADCELYSNLPNALYEAGLQPQWSPRVYGPESFEVVDDIPGLERRLVGHPGVYLVWIDERPVWGNLASLETLSQHFELRKLGVDDRVEVFRILPK